MSPAEFVSSPAKRKNFYNNAEYADLHGVGPGGEGIPLPEYEIYAAQSADTKRGGIHTDAASFGAGGGTLLSLRKRAAGTFAAEAAALRRHLRSSFLVPRLQKRGYPMGTPSFGAGGGTRTHTVSPPTDFESVTSANSITPACQCDDYTVSGGRIQVKKSTTSSIYGEKKSFPTKSREDVV